MPISFRRAEFTDYDFCAQIYFVEMERTIRELNLNVADHSAKFRGLWVAEEVRIITLDGADVGWVQTRTEPDALFLAQIFLEPSFQGRGIGTEVLRRILGEAGNAGRAVKLGVVKSNRAQRLYRRLGFQVTHEDERKFYMRREPGP